MSSQREVFSKNLRRLIDSRGIDQNVLADYLGVSEMSVSNWVNGVKYPRMTNIQKIADYFGVMKSDLIEDKSNSIIKETSSQYNYIPAEISAGLPDHVEAVKDAEKVKIPDALMGKWAGDNSIYITRVNGESMNKVIPHDSLIAVRPVSPETLKNGDIVVYKFDSEYAVKRFYKQDNKVIFRPDSNDLSFTDLVIDLEHNDLDIKIKGKVVLYIVELD